MRLSNFFIESIGLYLPESYSTESALANETLSAAAPHDSRSSRETSPAFTVCSPKRSPRPSTLSMPPWRLSRTKPRSGEIAVAGYCARHTTGEPRFPLWSETSVPVAVVSPGHRGRDDDGWGKHIGRERRPQR